jgi:hypothetical protein
VSRETHSPESDLTFTRLKAEVDELRAELDPNGSFGIRGPHSEEASLRQLGMLGVVLARTEALHDRLDWVRHCIEAGVEGDLTSAQLEQISKFYVASSIAAAKVVSAYW